MENTEPKPSKPESRRKKVRRERLKLLLEKKTAVSVAAEVGTEETYLSAIVNGTRGLGDALAERIEEQYDLGAGWFDREGDEDRARPVFTPEAMDIAREFDSLMKPEEREWALKTWRQMLSILKGGDLPGESGIAKSS